MLGFVHSNAQTKKAFIQAAEEAFAQKNYYAALKYFNIVLEFDENDRNALRKSAISAREFNAYDVAAQKYTYLIDSLSDNSDSLDLYHTALMFQRMGQYDKATEYFDRYILEYGAEDEFTEKVKNQKEKTVWASSRFKEVDENVSIKRDSTEVNSNFSDFGGSYLNDSLYFSSMRFLEEDSELDPPRQFSKILKRGNEGVNPIDTDFNKENKVLANITFNQDESKAFYTVCEYVSESELRCDIYQAIVRKDGTLSDPRMLPAMINDTSATNTHPFMTKDPVSDNEILFFVSDRDGGQGMLDIWYSVYDSKLGYSKPINLSSVNTDGNEATPFYHPESSTLFFSSDGRFGLGGYDIYESVYNGGIYEEPNALSAPINSSYHDLYYYLNDDGTEGLISSNRDGSSYIDNMLKACCFDIYELDIKPIEIDLIALTFDKLSNLELNGATVELIEEQTEELVAEVTSEDSHEHLFKIRKNKKYLVIGKKDGYVSDTIRLSTFNLESEEPIEEKLFLDPKGIALDVFTFDANTREALNGATVELEDLTDPTANRIIELNEKGNNFEFLLERENSYRIIAKKNGYNSVTEVIDTRGVTGKITRKLYLQQFELGAYLPITLYFDNDEPEPDSKSTHTDLAYGDILDAYMLRKQTYKDKYAKGAKGDDESESLERMEEFFEGDVRGGFDQFKIFMDGLINELQSGKRMDMTIRGFASPRFNVTYNLVLAQRRITSVRNEMMRYKNGVIKPYLDNKQLIMTEISFGEELAPPEVSDNLYDERESIYSWLAAKQRRVEVISIISK